MSHLRLVKPSEPKPPRRPKRERPPHIFTAEEQARLRAALTHARALFGTWSCVVDALHVDALNPDLAQIAVPCRPWALATDRAAELVLLISDEGVGLVWALWRWPGGELQDVAIGRA